MKKRDELNTVRDVVLRNLGVKTLDDINGWYRKFKAGTYRIDKLAEAVALASKFKSKKVLICGDYDCDGVTSTSILMHGLKAAGFTNVSYRIPKRFTEGFGLNRTMIDEAIANKVDLVITCDNGVAQVDPVNFAHDNDITIIILDHHEPSVNEAGESMLPNADIIIDPNAIPNSADFKGYCGAGLCYRFIREMLRGQDSSLYLGWAALGTVADVMELREENWCIVRYGLNAILKDTTSGTRALLQELGLTTVITATDVGFKIGPALNATSRLNDEGAMLSVRALLCEKQYEAFPLASALVDNNNTRKQLKVSMLKYAETAIKEHGYENETPIIVRFPESETREGLLGIIAGALCEKYARPAIVVGEHDGILKGSARSCGNFSIKKALDECQTLLERYGGHEGAAGLSLKAENFEAFCKKMQELGKAFVPEKKGETLYDLVINAADIKATINEILKYEPFGMGNAPVVFRVNDYTPIPNNGKFVSFIGDGSIAKMQSKDGNAICFDVSKETFKTGATKYTLVGTLSLNTFGGKSEPQIEVVECIPEMVENTKTELASLLESLATT